MARGGTVARTSGAGAPAGVLARLRAETRALHTEVEDGLDLMSPRLDPARYRDVLARLHGVHAAAEPALDAWHARDALLDWPRRRKLAALEADLADLGLDLTAIAALPLAPLPPAGTTAEALGTLYVLEGSTLGGRVIERHLRTLPGFPVAATRFLTCYGAQTGARWQTWRRTASAWVGDDETRSAAVIAAAVQTFVCVRDWCAPLADGVAA